MVILAILVGAGGIYHHKNNSPSSVLGDHTSNNAGSNISKSQMDIPVYSPANLPAGWKVSGSKVIKKNVMQYQVTSQNNDNYYITIQPYSNNTNPVNFNKSFTKPISYVTTAGYTTVGTIGNQLIASIAAGKSWVMINSPAVNSVQDMQTLTKSLKPVSI